MMGLTNVRNGIFNALNALNGFLKSVCRWITSFPSVPFDP